ncbi:hypothetical protein [Kitasatospora aureofaciens]|uniref:hypothetical protein n=1 Tax=Kitasatospora aureofaciens TaxID=1894 RepID=UPI0033FC7AE6
MAGGRDETVAQAGGQGSFDVVRRGYDTAAVDAYLALPPELRPTAPRFEVARRGYDRAQVDRAVAAARTVVGLDPASAPVAAPVPGEASAGGAGRRGFDLVRHGYERSQVDAYLAQAPDRRQPRPRFRVVARGYAPGQVDRAVTEAFDAQTAALPLPVFATAWRGYDTGAVDAFLALAPHHRPDTPVFAVVRGGYRRTQVDAYLHATTHRPMPRA